jgi:DNA polymerase-3 subunit alpha (Gram-positive type)
MVMGMLFFEVFDQLSNLPKDMEGLFREASVERVTVSKSKAEFRIYMKSNRLIQRKTIKKMEFQLYKQLFSSTQNKVVIYENYNLSDQYTPEKLFFIYRDSILEEFKDKSILEYNVFELAEIRFEENVLIFDCEENFLVRKMSGNISGYLTDLFHERFNYDIRVRFEYHEPKKKEDSEEHEYESIKNKLFNEEHNPNSSEHNRKQTENLSSDSLKQDIQANQEIAVTKDKGNDEKSNEEKTVKSKSTYEKGKYNYKKTINDPDTIYGKGFEGDAIPIADVQDEIGEVVIRGKIINVEPRELRNEKTIIIFSLTDFTDSIQGKIFIKTEDAAEVINVLKAGQFIKLKGMALMDKYDHEVTIGSIIGIKTIPDFTTIKMDNSPVKRVELHAHTMMSDMDAVVDVKDLVKRAFAWGHKAIAITDHGVVQSFPEANHALNKKDYPESEWERLKEFKVLYGVEAYLVDDLKEVVGNEKGQTFEDSFVVFDIETTGFGPVKDRIIEIGAVKIKEGSIVDKYSTFINPDVPIPFEIEELTGINDEMVMEYPKIDVILPEFLEFCNECALVAHNASFDVSFITKKAQELGIETDFTVIDTVGLARILLPDLSRYKLNNVAKALDISLENHHRAVDDAGATAKIYLKFVDMLKAKGITGIDDINSLGKMTPEAIKKMPTYHAIILAQNDIGRVNLYKLISLSHIDYYNKRPRIPKSVFLENREGLLIGSACEAGELYQAILREQPPEEIHRLVNFYDYLEIQPLGNNEFMIQSDKINISSQEELMDINRK